MIEERDICYCENLQGEKDGQINALIIETSVRAYSDDPAAAPLPCKYTSLHAGSLHTFVHRSRSGGKREEGKGGCSR